MKTVCRRLRARDDPEAAEDFTVLPPDDLGRVQSFDGTQLAVRAAGPVGGPLILFTHGLTLDMTTWHYQWPRFSDRYRCVLFDHRGHGRSGRPAGGDYSLSAVGRDIRAVLDRAAPSQPVFLVGHSLGGMAILSFADQHPDEFENRVAGVVLVDTAASDVLGGFLGSVGSRIERWLRPLADRALFDRPERADLIRSAAHGWGHDLAVLIARMMNFGPYASLAQIHYLTSLSTGAPTEVWTHMLRGLMDLDFREALAAITVPTLVVVGKHDSLTPSSGARSLAGALPNGRAIVLTRAGHVPMMERHWVFNELLEAHLEGVLSHHRAVG